MSLSAKAKAKSNTSCSKENRGMGLLLVFFREDNTTIADKAKLLCSPSSSSSSKSPNSSFRRLNSNLLLSKAQSTISICALLVFITLLLFTLSTFEPTIPSTSNTLPHTTSRRFLSQKPPTIQFSINTTTKTKTHYWFANLWKPNSTRKIETFPSIALQGMGTLYRRGTRAMNDLVVGHVAEDVTDNELRLFLRFMHRSGLTARADIVFIFASPSISSRFVSIIQEENDSFLSLIQHYQELSLNSSSQKSRSSFDVTQFFKVVKKDKEMVESEPLWGRRIRSNYSDPDARESETSESTRLTYGSVLSFDATELDPENSLSGFFDHVPMSLRRWACYPMLLGRVRRNFKHVMLADVKNLVVVNDPLGRIRNRSPESVYLYTKLENSSSSKHKKISSDKTQSRSLVNSAILMGGARGIRRFSNSMLTELVRAAVQHKKKSSVTESGILSQLVGNVFMLKNVNLITSTELIPETSSLAGQTSGSAKSLWDFTVIQRGNNNHEFSAVIMKPICSSLVDSFVYRDC
ncbi:Transmembrane protein [Quillaja saponaria]|uniref:Transmembrane protein n=1 Tax=Quillaja saponaria TaxID=32244 RepID=A0AAD7Q8C5_QUISA|nr:Transmembrane protein [Quillaja saponaria]